MLRRGNPGVHIVSKAVSLRPASVEDAAAIRALTREAYAKWVPLIGREPKPMTADYAQAVRKHRIDLPYLDGDLAALIEMIPRADHLLIENIAVSPAHQRSGIGRRLLAHAEQVAASLGHLEIRLYTNALFAGNVRLYQRMGYAIDREAAIEGGVRVDMSKRIQA
jgi:GNAT superfamily N-acetyltransferase